MHTPNHTHALILNFLFVYPLAIKHARTHEHIHAIISGLPANIIGIMPEKTIKLAGNDFFRNMFKVDDPKVEK